MLKLGFIKPYTGPISRCKKRIFSLVKDDYFLDGFHLEKAFQFVSSDDISKINVDVI